MLWSDLKDNPRIKNIYQTRLSIIKLIREFFWSHNFIETETSIAIKYPGQEPHLNPIPVYFYEPDKTKHKYFLQTSPELAMKKLLASGFEKIFQICKCFRDNEQFGGLHYPEFTMLEWYRAPGTLENIMDDVETLFKYIATELKVKSIKFKAHEVNIVEKWERLSMREVWKKFLNIELNDYLTGEKMVELAESKGYIAEIGEPYEDVFYKIFLNEIEQKLGVKTPVIIYDYPEQMTSMSKLSPKDPRYAERFELYIAGLELANAFGELTEAKEQKRRMEVDKQKRKKMNKETWPIDHDFISALESGIPSKIASDNVLTEAGGIALGVDRLIMLFTGANNINEVIYLSEEK